MRRLATLLPLLAAARHRAGRGDVPARASEDAYEHFSAGGKFGKIVVTFGPCSDTTASPRTKRPSAPGTACSSTASSSFKHLIVSSLALHGARCDAGASRPPKATASLDVGCGFGDTTLQLAELVGPTGRRSASTSRRASSKRPRGSARARRRERALRGHRRAGDAVRRHVRLRVRALRDDVLREPGRGACATSTTRSSRAGASARSSGAGARTTSGCTARSRSSSRSSRCPRRPTKRAAGPARSRSRTPTRRARFTRRPDSSTSRSIAATCR